MGVKIQEYEQVNNFIFKGNRISGIITYSATDNAERKYLKMM